MEQRRERLGRSHAAYRRREDAEEQGSRHGAMCSVRGEKQAGGERPRAWPRSHSSEVRKMPGIPRGTCWESRSVRCTPGTKHSWSAIWLTS